MEWLRDTQWLWWVAAALALGLVEIASLDLVFLMLSVAALAAALAAAAGVPLTVQVLVFVAAAMLLLAVLRPLAIRKLKPAGPGQRTNVSALVGRHAEVLIDVTQRSGLVKLAGEQWSARAADPDQMLAVGSVVEVVAIEGASAVVAPLPERITAPDPPT